MSTLSPEELLAKARATVEQLRNSVDRKKIALAQAKIDQKIKTLQAIAGQTSTLPDVVSTGMSLEDVDEAFRRLKKGIPPPPSGGGPPPEVGLTVQLTVFDNNTALPVLNATTTLGTTSKVVDSNGQSTFTGISPGSYRVTATAPGYQDAEETIQVDEQHTGFQVQLSKTKAATRRNPVVSPGVISKKVLVDDGVTGASALVVGTILTVDASTGVEFGIPPGPYAVAP